MSGRSPKPRAGAADPTLAHFRRLHPLTPLLRGWAWLPAPSPSEARMPSGPEIRGVRPVPAGHRVGGIRGRSRLVVVHALRH